MLFFTQLVLALLTPSVTAVAIPRACAATCSSVCYSQSAIDAAVHQGYSLHEDGQLAGNYPHKYNDYEGFNFPNPGPWYEFPIMSSSKVYTGGAPGADRVVFDASGRLQDVITHQGASGNNFVECS